MDADTPQLVSTSAPGEPRSDLLNTAMQGTLRVFQFAQKLPLEPVPGTGVVTTMARSTRSSAFFVRSMRSSPKAPWSSMPAVSIKTTGPKGNSSIGFFHRVRGRAAMAETIETFCPARAFKMLDLPTLRRPKIPIWQRRLFGGFFAWGAPPLLTIGDRAGRRLRRR